MTAWLDTHPGEAIALLVVAYWLTWALAATPALILERRLRRETRARMAQHATAQAVMRERLLADLGAELADEAEAHLREVSS